jgi:hypothetical protein
MSFGECRAGAYGRCLSQHWHICNVLTLVTRRDLFRVMEVTATTIELEQDSSGHMGGNTMKMQRFGKWWNALALIALWVTPVLAWTCPQVRLWCADLPEKSATRLVQCAVSPSGATLQCPACPQATQREAEVPKPLLPNQSCCYSTWLPDLQTVAHTVAIDNALRSQATFAVERPVRLGVEVLAPVETVTHGVARGAPRAPRGPPAAATSRPA